MNKIIHRFQLILIYGFVFLGSAFTSAAQDTVLNKYGLWVIGTVEQLQKTQLHNPSKAMINLKKMVPGLVLDLRYASENNFMHEKLYPPVTTTFLRRAAADSLAVI